MRYKVVVATRSFGSTSQKPWDVLAEGNCEPVTVDITTIADQELINVLGDADGFIVGRRNVTSDIIAACSKLKVICMHGMGVDHIDLEAAKKTDDGEFKRLLEKLAGEEKKHFHMLEQQYDSLIHSEKWISTADVLKAEGLPEIKEDMTSRHQELINEVRNAAGLPQILDIALRLEYEARDFEDSRDALGV